MKRALKAYLAGLAIVGLVSAIALAAWGLADPAVKAELLEIRANMGGPQ